MQLPHSTTVSFALIFLVAVAQAVTLPKMYITNLDSENNYYFSEFDPNTAQITPLIYMDYRGSDPIQFGVSAFDPLKKMYYSTLDGAEIDVGNMTNNQVAAKIKFDISADITQIMFDPVYRRLLVTQNTPDWTANVLSSAAHDSNYKWTKIYTINLGCCSIYGNAYYFDSAQFLCFINIPHTWVTKTYLSQVEINSGAISKIPLNESIAGLGGWQFVSLDYDPITSKFVALGVIANGDDFDASIAIINSNGIQNLYKILQTGADTPRFMRFDPKSRCAVVFLSSAQMDGMYIIVMNIDSGQIVMKSPLLPTPFIYNAEFVPKA